MFPLKVISLVMLFTATFASLYENAMLALKTLAWLASVGENKYYHIKEGMTKVIM